MKKTFVFILVLLSLLSIVVTASGEEFEIDSKYAAVYNLEQKKFLFEKEANTIIYPASLTKIMTGILACDYYEALGGNDFYVTVSADVLENVSGNKMGLCAGERVSFYDLICALLVGSANDAAYVIAETVGGSVESFVSMMNERAAKLGAHNTNYSNPSGFHSPYMYTTLFDQALICAHAAEKTKLLEISSLVSYEMTETDMSGKRTFTNQNLLFDAKHWLRHYTPNTRGLNVGMTSEAGWCLATVYDNDGLTNIVLVSGGRVEKFEYHYLNDAKALMKYTADKFDFITLLDSNKAMCDVEVELGRDKDRLLLATSRDITALLPIDIDKNTDVKIEYTLSKDTFTAPIEEGEVFGTVSAFYKGELVGSVELVATTDVKMSIPLFILDKISSFFKIPLVKALVSLILSLLFAFCCGAFIYVNVKRRRRLKERRRALAKSVSHARKNINKY